MRRELLTTFSLLRRLNTSAASRTPPLFFWDGPNAVVPIQDRDPRQFTVIERLRQLWRVDPVVVSFAARCEAEGKHAHRNQVAALQSDLQHADWGSTHNPARLTFELGMLHAYHGAYDKATECFQARLDNPSKVNAQYWRAKSEAMLDAIEQQHYPSLTLDKHQRRLAEAMKPHGGGLVLAGQLKVCGDAAAACGQYDKAIDFYQRMVGVDASRSRSADWSWGEACLGTLSVLNDQGAVAVEHYHAGLQSLPSDDVRSALVRASLAAAYAQIDERPSAADELAKASAVCARELGADHGLTQMVAGCSPDVVRNDCFPEFYTHF